MYLIVATGRDWAIGRDGGLLVENPVDMKFFRETTMGKVVIMGRKTLESFPGGTPLKNRVNIVLTRNEDFEREGAIIAHSPDEVRKLVKDYGEDQVFVIGGEQIYRAFLKDCTKAYVTRMRQTFPADTWFPDLDQDPEWELAEKSEIMEWNGIQFTFCTYERKFAFSGIFRAGAEKNADRAGSCGSDRQK